MVERDPTRAMALAQLSLASGVSRHFSQLLLSLRVADAERADLLFAYAVGGLERSRDVELSGAARWQQVAEAMGLLVKA